MKKNTNDNLGHRYVNADKDHEHIDSYYSRSSGQENPYQTLNHDITTPVCVIGGGLAGVETTLGLVERGISHPVLIEANRVGWGTSGRNGGFVTIGYSLPPFEILNRVGQSHAKELMALTQSALKLIRKRIQSVKEDLCDPVEGMLSVSWFDEEDMIKSFVKKMDQVFHEKLEFWPREKVRDYYRSNRYYDAFFNPNGLQVHALKFTCHMAKLASELGAVIFEKSPALKVKKIKDKWHVKTEKGFVIADEVVYCCSGYIGNLHPRLSNATLPVATYVLLPKPLGDRLRDAIRTPRGVIDNRTSASYYRPLSDGRLLWGGKGLHVSSVPGKVGRDYDEKPSAYLPTIRGDRGGSCMGRSYGVFKA